MTADVLDFAIKRAELLAEKLEPIPEERPEDVILSCPSCENKAFTLLTCNREESAFPGWDVICTACDSIVEDLTGDLEFNDLET